MLSVHLRQAEDRLTRNHMASICSLANADGLVQKER